MSLNRSLICGRDRKVRLDAVNVRRFTLHTKYPLSLTYTTDAIKNVLQDSPAILMRFARIIRKFIDLCTEYSSRANRVLISDLMGCAHKLFKRLNLENRS